MDKPSQFKYIIDKPFHLNSDKPPQLNTLETNPLN